MRLAVPEVHFFCGYLFAEKYCLDYITRGKLSSNNTKVPFLHFCAKLSTHPLVVASVVS